jgi:hypothetical protein
MTAHDPAPNPFGDDSVGTGPAGRLKNALTRLRRLRTQVGTDGFTPAGARMLVDETVKALEALEEMSGGER